MMGKFPLIQAGTMSRILWLLTLLWVHIDVARGEVIVDAPSSAVNLGRQAFVYASSPEVPVEHIIGNREIPWQASESDLPSYGFTEQTYWFDIALRSTEDQPLERLLEIGYPLLDHVRIYLIREGRILQTLESGDARPFGERLMHHRLLLFP